MGGLTALINRPSNFCSTPVLSCLSSLNSSSFANPSFQERETNVSWGGARERCALARPALSLSADNGPQRRGKHSPGRISLLNPPLCAGSRSTKERNQITRAALAGGNTVHGPEVNSLLCPVRRLQDTAGCAGRRCVAVRWQGSESRQTTLVQAPAQLHGQRSRRISCVPHLSKADPMEQGGAEAEGIDGAQPTGNHSQRRTGVAWLYLCQVAERPLPRPNGRPCQDSTDSLT